MAAAMAMAMTMAMVMVVAIAMVMVMAMANAWSREETKSEKGDHYLQAGRMTGCC